MEECIGIFCCLKTLMLVGEVVRHLTRSRPLARGMVKRPHHGVIVEAMTWNEMI